MGCCLLSGLSRPGKAEVCQPYLLLAISPGGGEEVREKQWDQVRTGNARRKMESFQRRPLGQDHPAWPA